MINPFATSIVHVQLGQLQELAAGAILVIWYNMCKRKTEYKNNTVDKYSETSPQDHNLSRTDFQFHHIVCKLAIFFKGTTPLEEPSYNCGWSSHRGFTVSTQSHKCFIFNIFEWCLAKVVHI